MKEQRIADFGLLIIIESFELVIKSMRHVLMKTIEHFFIYVVNFIGLHIAEYRTVSGVAGPLVILEKVKVGSS